MTICDDDDMLMRIAVFPELQNLAEFLQSENIFFIYHFFIQTHRDTQ